MKDFEDGATREMKEFKNQPKVLIGYPTGEFGRHATFYDCLNFLQRPNGTIMSASHGQSPARGRNQIINQALEHNCTHIFFLDDDLMFAPDTLVKLMAHEKDIITGLYVMRNNPHQPIIFDIALDDGRCQHHFLGPNENGLVPIVAAGLGCCLIKTEVFKVMDEDPENKKQWIRLGELERDHWCDDIGFFRRAILKFGFKAFCDLETRVGHQAVVTLWPKRINGVWHTVYDCGGDNLAAKKQIQSVEEGLALKAGRPLWDNAFRGQEDDSFRELHGVSENQVREIYEEVK